jgi:protein required for attachment to host cells
MQFPNGTTFAIADGKHLRLFRNSGDAHQLQLQELPLPVLSSFDKGSSGSRHRSTAANPDGQLQDEDGHAAATAAFLNQQVLSGQIEGLYVVAPPRTLGELRRHYHASLKAKLLGELDKEHTGDSAEKLLKALLAA